VESPLPILHFVTLPVRYPVKQPEQVDYPGDNEEEEEAEFELLQCIMLRNLAFGTIKIACSFFTYGVLVPKEVEEGVEREVVVGAGEA